jgi:UDP-glucuronate 4-epimerase
MQILVTGGAGFIGSHLIERLLAHEINVVCYDNFDPFYDAGIKRANLYHAMQHSNFKLIEASILDYTTLNTCFENYKIDLVIHLAAKAGVRPSIADPMSYYETNVDGTLNVLEAMKHHSVKKMVFASSSSVYGNNAKVPFSESDFVDHPISPYAASKKAAELICHTYHHLYGFDIFCMRFFTVFGPRQRPDLAIHKFAELILNEQTLPIYGDGSSSRDYTYIEDIIDGLMKAIDNLNGYNIFNLGESRTITLLQMVESVQKHIGKKAKINSLPMQLGDVLTTFADISKAKEILGYNPSWSFDEGIKKFIEWKRS